MKIPSLSQLAAQEKFKGPVVLPGQPGFGKPLFTVPPPAPQYDFASTGLAGRVPVDHHNRDAGPGLKHEIVFEMLREFTPKERLLLFIGCNVVIKASVQCRHNPGVIAPAAVATVEDVELKKSSRFKWLFYVHCPTFGWYWRRLTQGEYKPNIKFRKRPKPDEPAATPPAVPPSTPLQSK